LPVNAITWIGRGACGSAMCILGLTRARRQFKVLKKQLCPTMEEIKQKSQENASQHEVKLT
jgi:hypothetical protein